MTVPAVLFGILLSTLFGAAFHLWKGGGPGRISMFIIVSWIGFWAGHFLAAKINFNFLNFGSLHLFMAVFGSILFLFVGNFLFRPTKKSGK